MGDKIGELDRYIDSLKVEDKYLFVKNKIKVLEMSSIVDELAAINNRREEIEKKIKKLEDERLNEYQFTEIENEKH